ncbi:MAG: DUF4157 domain-containing protein [Kofleriaceae bacterium]|nr:DUF4157 domain-containing protein [Kofleriaceae bacterium]MBP9172688.1 DUF4157 domain-containing protein [Kofleriaceae bacterium]MBP9862098.1 DUF4157 domain-containing protein [Kofleriaceae bacterium]
MRSHRATPSPSNLAQRTGGGVPGRRTLTDSLQRKTAPAPVASAGPLAPAASALEDPFALHLVAEHGTASGGAALPHRDAIQASFGHHPVSQVAAHVGGDAAAACEVLGAQAFATGERVGFASAPDLHTAAHEAAHVVQQRSGVQLKGGVGEADDPYERHADAVADRVVRGESAEALLDQHAGGGGGPAIQRKPSELRREYGEHPLVTLSLGKRVTHPGWNAYLIELLQYLGIDDKDLLRRQGVFGTLYVRAKSLVHERKDGRDFTDEQHQLATEINDRLETEKLEVFGSTVGMLRPDADVPTVTGVEPVIGGQEQYQSQVDPRFFPLFERQPSMADVQQGGLGDCYLLAAAASVVHRAPMHFVEHMTDNLDGTVTVRLYEDVGRPIQVVVEKSVPGNRYAKNVLWVKILEKAYAASGLALKPTQKDKVKAYKDIESGSSSTALLHLTGTAAGTMGVGRTRNGINTAMVDGLEHEEKAVKKRADSIRDEMEKLEKAIREKTNQDEKADVSGEQSALKELELQFREAMVEWSRMQDPVFDLTSRLSMMLVTQGSFQQFVDTHSGNPVVQRILDEVVPVERREGLFPGDIGTGLYGRDEQQAFAVIKRHIDDGKPMTAGTKNSINDRDNQVEGRGASGEPKVKGLAGKHAYSLLDYKPKGERASGEPIFLKLRNPWGEYGRDYEKQENGRLKAFGFQGDGTFWIDLADFVANFQDINWLG